MSDIASSNSEILKFNSGDIIEISNSVPIIVPYLWLKADSGIVKNANDRVYQWLDQGSGIYNATQNVLVNQPLWVENVLNGKPILRFEGDDFLKVQFGEILPQPCTYYAVYSSSMASTISVTRPLFGGEESFGQIISGFDGKLSYFAGNWSKGNISEPFSHLLVTASFNGSSSYLRHNGLLASNLNPGSNFQASNIYIGGYFHSSNPRLIGDIAEILLYRTVHSEVQQTSIENYLITKYGLVQ